MLIVDTGPLVALVNRNDKDHGRCAELRTSRTDDLLVTPYVVTEACYLIGKYVGAEAEINLVEALAAGDITQIDIVPADLERMTQLMRQYRGFPRREAGACRGLRTPALTTLAGPTGQTGGAGPA